MRLLLSGLLAVLTMAACAGSSDIDAATTTTPVTSPAPASTVVAEQPVEDAGPGGYGFDRSDPATGVANIMEAFATDEATATCVFEAWGDVANVPPEELTTELMTYEICGTSILRMITGSG